MNRNKLYGDYLSGIDISTFVLFTQGGPFIRIFWHSFNEGESYRVWGPWKTGNPHRIVMETTLGELN